MKTLLIMRHAKAGGKDGEMPDYKRHLKPQGERDARKMGQLIKQAAVMPDLILTSGATRTRQTADVVVETCGYEGDIQATRCIYYAKVADILGCLQELGDNYQRVMIIGHNPDLEMLVETLTGTHHRIPTGALVHLDVAVDRWSDLDEEAEGTLQDLWRPKDLD
jgi:phosphohistidine phosphatase